MQNLNQVLDNSFHIIMANEEQNWEDIALLVLSILLACSECLPFIRKIKGNGILHTLTESIKEMSEYSRSRKETSPTQQTPQE